MKDRIAQNPGRVLVKPENGNAQFYATLERADNPIQEGDALNKANLLTDATAALLGLGENAVPDDAFAQFGLHWWKRRAEESGYALYTSPTATTYKPSSMNLNTTFFYADSVAVNDDNTMRLVDASTRTINITSYTSEIPFLANKYFYASSSTSGASDALQRVYKAGASVPYNIDTSTLTEVYVTTVEYYENIGEYEYLSSPDRNAYPDSGVEGIFSYQYLAVPFENAREGGAKIVTGSYVGTGTYGQSNPCKLTFDFAPKMLIFWGSGTATSTYSSSHPAILRWGGTTLVTVSSYGANTFSYDGNTVSWYLSYGDSADSQWNASGNTYYYTAIG